MVALPTSLLTRTLGGLAVAAVGALGYAAGYEVRAFRLREFTIPVLPPGSDPIRVLHLSDLHLTPGQRRKREWLRRLGELEPDLVVNTGDNIAHVDAVPALIDALDPLLDRPGVFVFGSNDYYAPKLKNPARYLLPDNRRRARLHGGPLPWPMLRDAFLSRNWVDLTNATARLSVADRKIAFVGVDDPHLGYDRMPEGRAPEDVDLTVGVTHAPYQHVLSSMTAAGYRLLLAGHTHGGQLCVPWWGALVTNCDLETNRAKGLSRHPALGGRPAAWMHVSAGLGTSPYAPVRFACYPEASLLTLTQSPFPIR